LAFAHSKSKRGKVHPLAVHLCEVGELAAWFAVEFNCPDLARLIGLLHDCGKCAVVWQEKLEAVSGTKERVGIDHKTLGCEVAEQLDLGDLSVVLHGHHGGLTSPRSVKRSRESLGRIDLEALADARGRYTEVTGDLQWAEQLRLPWEYPYVTEMGLRLLFSALVDADFLDTAAHFADQEQATPAAHADLDHLLRRFEKAREAKLADREPSPRDPERQAIYEACIEAAMSAPGIYRLSVGTGLGKTFSGMGFALRHAAAHGKRRVVVAVPWKTVTEQNAEEYRHLLDTAEERVVLEHHSGVDMEGAGRRWEREAAENWDAPIVVTTTVRLFESMFGRTASATRRLHRLANSVIILDEVQGLPYRLLVPILDGLRSFVEHFNATVLLCSATQPAFWSLQPFQDLPVTDIVPNPLAVPVAATPIRYEWWLDPRPRLSQVATRAAEHGSALVVTNTIADAATVAKTWETAGREGVFHLSTLLIPSHRLAVMKLIKQRLDAKLPTLVASTPLIEAGVNLDFPVVFRAITSIDSILQAAGRADRERRWAGGGLVVVFDPLDGGKPAGLDKLIGLTLDHFGPGLADPEAAGAQADYWNELWDELNLDAPGSVAAAIQQARLELDYEAVALGPLAKDRDKPGLRDRSRAFKMIEDETIAVIVPASACSGLHVGPSVHHGVPLQGAPEALVKRAADPGRSRAAMRGLQPYIVNLSLHRAQKDTVKSRLKIIIGDPARPGSVAVWQGTYNPLTGLDIE
jgi:CRISPR-associated endonuclease/helicase Cas3